MYDKAKLKIGIVCLDLKILIMIVGLQISHNHDRLFMIGDNEKSLKY